MKLQFTWTSGHSTIQLRLLRASGEDVKVLNDHGDEVAPPSLLHRQQMLHISPPFVAYGAEQGWLLRVLVDDVTNTVLTKLCVRAVYDDTVAPATTEDLVRDENVNPNEASDHDKMLTIPLRAP